MDATVEIMKLTQSISEYSILVVDDHPTMREALRYVLTASGAEQVEEASCCEEASRRIQSRHFDVVLLDLTMSDGSGLELLREIKSHDPDVGVLIHTYHDEAALLGSSFQLGADGYLVKGEDKTSLIEAVRRVGAGQKAWTNDQWSILRNVVPECLDGLNG